MREQPKINVWALKEKELLEKLSLEISSDFSISEKLAKKLLYKTHLSLSELKDEIYLDQDEKLENKDKFDEQKLEKLFFSISWIKEIIENASKLEIEELKQVLENSDFLKLDDNQLIKKFFSKQLIDRAKNPKNISDQIMWASLWITNSTIIITDTLYNIWRGFITSVPDLISILSWKWEIESIKKV